MVRISKILGEYIEQITIKVLDINIRNVTLQINNIKTTLNIGETLQIDADTYFEDDKY